MRTELTVLGESVMLLIMGTLALRRPGQPDGRTADGTPSYHRVGRDCSYSSHAVQPAAPSGVIC